MARIATNNSHRTRHVKFLNDRKSPTRRGLIGDTIGKIIRTLEEKNREYLELERNYARTWSARSTSIRRYRRRTKQRIYKRIQSWESLQSNVAGGNKLSNDETYVGVASHLHRRSAYRVQHQAHVLRSTPLLPRVPKRAYQPPNNGRPIIIDSLSLSPLPSLDMLQLPRPSLPNLSTIFSCFVAVSGDPLPQHRHTRPRVIAAEGSFFLGRSHRSNTLSRDRLSGSSMRTITDATLSISLLFLDLFIPVFLCTTIEQC